MYRNDTLSSLKGRANPSKSHAFKRPAESQPAGLAIAVRSTGFGNETDKRYRLTSKKSGSKAGSAVAGDAKRKPGKNGLKDLDAKGGRKIRGGKWSRDNGSVSSSTTSS